MTESIPHLILPSHHALSLSAVYNSARMVKYWSKECSASVDASFLVAKDEDDAYNWLVGPQTV